MINGAHVIVESKDPDADRAFLRDVLGLSHVDVGGGWLIFGLPPAEVAIHPAKKSGAHQLYLMCEDIYTFVRAMKQKKLACDEVKDQGWGLLTAVALPGGGKLGVYEPRHERPTGKPAKKTARKPTRKPAQARKSKKTPRRR